MCDVNIAVIRARLREHFIPYKEGGELRAQLKAHAEATYVKQHTADEYMHFINENECDFKVQHNQAANFPYYWRMFSVRSQHVSGDCIEECLDNAMAYIAQRPWR